MYIHYHSKNEKMVVFWKKVLRAMKHLLLYIQKMPRKSKQVSYESTPLVGSDDLNEVIF